MPRQSNIVFASVNIFMCPTCAVKITLFFYYLRMIIIFVDGAIASNALVYVQSVFLHCKCSPLKNLSTNFSYAFTVDTWTSFSQFCAFALRSMKISHIHTACTEPREKASILTVPKNAAANFLLTWFFLSSLLLSILYGSEQLSINVVCTKNKRWRITGVECKHTP